jgi:lysophospholipase L1-like esterase
MKKMVILAVISLIMMGGILFMSYVGVNNGYGWANSPSTATPMSADNLNIMEKGIKDAHAVLDGKVDKVTGKGLSTNDYTNADKAEVAKIANKADKSYVDSAVSNIGNASPKGVYATLSALQAAYPTGTTGIYVVTADGKWYYWSGSAWVPGGVYQSTGIADKSITPIKTSFFHRGTNLFNKAEAVDGYYVSATEGILIAGTGWVVSDYIPIDATKSYIFKHIRDYAYYDASKTYISGATISGATPDPYDNRVLSDLPANAAYIRFSWNTSVLTIDLQQVNEGETLLAYEPYREYIKKENLEKHSVEFDDVTDIITTGKNLFDKSKAMVGYVVHEGTGAIYANAVYAASDYISVEPNTDYVSGFSRATAYYDESKKYISGAEYTTAITTPAGCRYVRVSPGVDAVETFQFEKGTVPTIYEPYGYKFTKEIPAQGHEEDFITEMVLPSKLYALVGQELNIYYDNIMNDKDTKYDFDVTCDIGGQYDNYYRVTPDTAGTYPITIRVYRDGIEKAIASSEIIVKGASVGSGVNKKVLIIGDSTTANGICTQKLLDNFGASEVMDITMLGTKGTAPNLNEGVSGWTANDFYATAGRGGVTNPFWNPSAEAFDFSYYMAQQSYTGVDYVIINLGINDIFSYTDDTTLQAKINTMLTQYQGMIDSIHAYDEDIKIGLALTIPPAYEQNAFGKSNGCGQTRWRYKRNNFLWVKALIEIFSGQEENNIYLVPINTNLDTRHNMGLEILPVNARNSDVMETSIIANGHVHPVESGYHQIADVYWYWLKSFES